MTGFKVVQSSSSQMQARPATSAFSPFRSHIFLAMWIASLLSNFGSLIQNVGATWLMTSLAPSADMVALVQVSAVLPIVLFSLPAGAAADVWDRRVIMLVAQGAMLVVSAALAILAWFGQVTSWLLVALTFLLGMGAALYGPPWQSSVREQVPLSDLPAAVALNSVAFNLARAVGPALGGAIVAWAGAKVAFGINAISYLGLIAVLLAWKRPPVEARLPPETMAAAMLAGLRFARLSHSLQTVLVRGAAFGFFAAALWALIPLVAKDLLSGGAITYGLLLAAFGGGAVAGALGGGLIRERLTNEMIVAGGSAAFGGAGLVAAFSPFLASTFLALVVGGAAWLLVLSTFNVTVQLRTPRWVVGRAMAIYQAGVFGGLSLGAWLWGVVAENYGVPTSLIAADLALVATALLGRILPMPATDQINLEPAALADPENGSSMPSLDPDSGPVVASTEYRITPSDVRAFLSTTRRLQRMRRRNGARRWALLHDAADPEIWIERFETPTWLDHMRVRDRMTVIDRKIEEEVLTYHRGEAPPFTRYLLSHIPAATDGEDRADASDQQAAVFDPTLPPGLATKRL
jgi:MFS family permease